jgi:pyrophosphate--fructose-6-phosphate 1-phosphotransferase
MGRSASHITLECALQTHVNLALVGEEIFDQKQTLAEVVHEIANLICERSALSKNYGAILIPEGLLEFVPEFQNLIKELNHIIANYPHFSSEIDGGEAFVSMINQMSTASIQFFNQLPKDIQKQLLNDRDPHGNIQFSKIETERLLIDLVQKELIRRKEVGQYQGHFNPQPLFCGYEGRCGLPSNFDCQYCYALGHMAALMINHKQTGYLCAIKNLAQSVEEWEPMGIPLVDMLQLEFRGGVQKAVIKKSLVDIKGPIFAIFAKQRQNWRLIDDYCSPGPMQFEGTLEVTGGISLTLNLT